jgi:hypothetical protein
VLRSNCAVENILFVFDDVIDDVIGDVINTSSADFVAAAASSAVGAEKKAPGPPPLCPVAAGVRCVFWYD